MFESIYLDYHSTTPVDPRVAKKVYDCMVNNFGNASSVDHLYGDQALEAVNTAKSHIANLVNCLPSEVIFTSGATESINLVIQGVVASHNLPCRIIISPVEHKAVIDTCLMLEKKGLVEIVWLKVDSQARIDLDFLENVCRHSACLLGVMGANNEVGNIYPLDKIAVIAEKHQIPLLCDASQCVGKIPVNFQGLGITFLTISGHKLYAPKGIGALIIKKGHHLSPLIYGGGHQGGVRSGTLNVSSIVGLGEACRLRQLEMVEDEKRIASLRNHLQSLLQAQIPDLVVNGDVNSRLAGNLHISLPNIPNSAIIARIRHKLAISTGSACTSATVSPSHVLRAMSLSDALVEGALRIGIGKFTTMEEVEKSAKILINAINQVSQLLS